MDTLSTTLAQALPDPVAEPEAALAAAVALRRTADRLEMAAVDAAIGQGWTWADLAQALGVSRQAVHKRHARRLRAAGDDTP